MPAPGLPCAVSSTCVVSRPMAPPSNEVQSCHRRIILSTIFLFLSTLWRGFPPAFRRFGADRERRRRRTDGQGMTAMRGRPRHGAYRTCICLGTMLTIPIVFVNSGDRDMALRRSGTASPSAAGAQPTSAVRRRASTVRKPASARVNEDEIYQRIYAAVLDHRLQPGTKLKEVALAELFRANRNVIRKVLMRLAYNRLVALRPNRGAVVASPSVEESRDLFAARRAVEAAIVDAVTCKIAPPEAKALRALTASERDAYRRGELRKALKLSLKFHQQL